MQVQRGLMHPVYACLVDAHGLRPVAAFTDTFCKLRAVDLSAYLR